MGLTHYKAPIGKSCAICAAFVPLDQGRYEPLGKGGAEVFACLRCCEEAAVSKFGPELAYETSGMLGNKQVSAALKRKQGSDGYARDSKLAQRVGLAPAPPSYDPYRASRAESGIRGGRRRDGR